MVNPEPVQVMLGVRWECKSITAYHVHTCTQKPLGASYTYCYKTMHRNSAETVCQAHNRTLELWGATQTSCINMPPMAISLVLKIYCDIVYIIVLLLSSDHFKVPSEQYCCMPGNLSDISKTQLFKESSRKSRTDLMIKSKQLLYTTEFLWGSSCVSSNLLNALFEMKKWAVETRQFRKKLSHIPEKVYTHMRWISKHLP